jgi:hypothetical protein
MRKLLPALTVLLAACAAGGGPRGTSVQPGELFSGGYIDIKAPASGGWLLTNSSGSGMTFGKEGPSKTESFIAAVLMFGMAPTNTPAELEELVRGPGREGIHPRNATTSSENRSNTRMSADIHAFDIKP